MKKILDNKFFRFGCGLIRGMFTVIIVFYLVFVIAQRVSGNKSIFGYRLFTVATGSMSGVYEVNDVIAVKDCNVDDLQVGDDIAYRGSKGGLEGLLITHRIIRIEEKEDGSGRLFVTKGVNAPAEDPVIEEDQILGKVVGIVPLITILNHAVKSQLGFFLLIFCPLVIIIVLEVLQTITDIQLEKHEIQERKKQPTVEEVVEEKEEVEEEKETSVEDNEEESEEVIEENDKEETEDVVEEEASRDSEETEEEEKEKE